MDYNDSDKCECRHAWIEHKGQGANPNPDRTPCRGTSFRDQHEGEVRPCGCGTFRPVKL